MRRLGMFVITCVALSLGLIPALAQSDDACSGELVAATISQYVADIEGSEDAPQILGLLEQLQGELDLAIRNCRSGGSAGSSGPGMGKQNNPFAFGVEGDTGVGFTVQVTGALRPADSVIYSANMFNDRAGDGQEYILLSVTVRCAQNSDRCEADYFDFELVGDAGVVYDSLYVAMDDKLEVNLFGGGEATGYLPFLIRSDDSNLMLIYQDNWSNDTPVFFRAEPSLDSGIEVTALSSINIRTLPSTNGGVVGSLAAQTPIVAFGRNEDGTWLQISSGWVFAELVTTEGDIQSLPVTAQ